VVRYAANGVRGKALSLCASDLRESRVAHCGANSISDLDGSIPHFVALPKILHTVHLVNCCDRGHSARLTSPASCFAGDALQRTPRLKKHIEWEQELNSNLRQNGHREESMFRAVINIVRSALGPALASFLSLSNSLSQTYSPPQNSASLTANLRFADATPLDEDYRRQFVNCDGNGPSGLKDHFRGNSLVIPGQPPNKQYYLCSRDPSHLGALLRMPDGAVFWQSKMALDVDGSWVAWSGRGGATDQQLTSYTWHGATDKASQAAQLDPDRIPFIVIPNDGLSRITRSAAKELGAEFVQRTGLRFGDMGVVIYRDQWTPVIVGDGGPFMRIGEASAKVFEAIGQSRCRGWNSDKSRCTGPAGGGYPYKNFGIDRDVLFIVWPNSGVGDIGPENALATLCSFAHAKLGLAGSEACPR
jgi:hypothetical protein